MAFGLRAVVAPEVGTRLDPTSASQRSLAKLEQSERCRERHMGAAEAQGLTYALDALLRDLESLGHSEPQDDEGGCETA